MGFANDHLIQLVDEGLGNSAYLVDLGDGRALAVDVSRDLRSVRATADRRGLRIAFAADTHLHADFLSGSRQLGHDTGARLLAAAGGHRGYDHTGLTDGDEVDLGGLRLRALATPGHTDEHLALLLLDGTDPLGVFSGGSLIVNSAARTDLLGEEHTEELTRAQYRSLRRLGRLSDDTELWPTHGAGSFCSAPPGTERTSTIGAQKRTNPLLAVPDEDTFVRTLIDSLGSYPRYFTNLGERNRRGPAVLTTTPELTALSPNQLRAHLDGGAAVVDTRPAADYAAGHIDGAVSNPLRAQFASWLGWLLPDTVPLIFVTGADQDPAEILWQSYKIGHEQLAGYLAGGMPAWNSAGGRTSSTVFAPPEHLGRRRYVDVRQRAEYVTGHVPGSLHIELGELAGRIDEVPRDAVIACGHGERAMSAASLLEQAGRGDVVVLDGGPGDYARATNQRLISGD